jgi:hypothetical protein
MWRSKNRVSLCLGILGLAAAATVAALLAFASGGNAASANTCTQLNATQANCLTVSVVPTVLSSNQTGLIVAKFKNTFANANTTHTVLTVTLPSIASDQPTSPAQATAISVSASPAVNCSPPPYTQVRVLSCNFDSVPGGATVVMYVQFQLTASGAARPSMDPVLGTVSFDESNGNTGATTNDSFKSYSDPAGTQVAAPITDGHGAAQGGLCTGALADTGFTTNFNGQQTNVSDLTATASGGLPCTPVSAGARLATADENSACGGSCATPVSFVFFPVLNNNATDTVAVILPTLPAGVSSWQKTPLFEILGTGSSQTRVQLVNCGVTPNPSPDTCIVGMAKFGSKGVQFTLSVGGSPFDGRYTG